MRKAFKIGIDINKTHTTIRIQWEDSPMWK